MKRLTVLLTLYMSVALAVFSCKSKEQISRIETDDMYFMSSDVMQINQSNSFDFTQENFSKRNVNPEYIARYQTQINDVPAVENRLNVQVYNNYFNGFGQPFFGPAFGGFYPLGLGLYDPFWYNGWGFGNRWFIGPSFGLVNFYDPFFNPFFPRFGWTGFYAGFAWSPVVYDRRIVRGSRPTRGSVLTPSNNRLNVAARPTNARSIARRDALPNRTINQDPTRTRSNENFRSPQRNYDSAKPTAPTNRTRQSPVMNRSVSPNSRTTTLRRTYTAPSRATTPTRSTPTRSTPSVSNKRGNR